MTAEPNKKIIVVLGAGRCGTSIVMQVLEKLGLSMSQNLVLPRAHNLRGPMEDADIAKVYDDLLQTAGSTRMMPLLLDRISDELKSQTRSRLKNIIVSNLQAANTIWGFKDPFTSSLLPLWFRIFNSTATIPVFILAVRNPAHSVISRKKHFGTLESIGELAWLVNYSEALHHTAADCYIVHYEDWFTRGEEMAGEILDYTGLNDFFGEGSVAGILESVINNEMNRSIYEDYEAQNEHVIRLYNALNNCRGRDFDRTGLMRAVKDCRSAMRDFLGWCEPRPQVGQPDALVEELSEVKKRLKRKRNAVDKMSSDLESLVLENNRLLNENQDLVAEVRNYRLQSAAPVPDLDIQARQWIKECLILKNSYSYRLGQIFVNAFKAPGKNTILMPYFLVKLVLDIISGRGREELRKALERYS